MAAESVTVRRAGGGRTANSRLMSAGTRPAADTASAAPATAPASRAGQDATVILVSTKNLNLLLAVKKTTVREPEVTDLIRQWSTLNACSL